MRFHKKYSVSESAIIGQNVRIGQNAIIHDHVEIGDNSIICENCIIGEPTFDSYNNENYVNPKTIIGSESLIRSGTIIYADSIFGDCFKTGNLVSIREKSIFGQNCIVGSMSDIQGPVIFGDYCRLNSHVQISANCTFGNFVFIYPFVIFTNDPIPPSNYLIGSKVGDFSQIAAGSVILPGITIGKHSIVGANSLLNRNVGDYELYSGNPAVKVCKVNYIWDNKNKQPHYPWPYNFDRGLPWEGQNFDEWLKSEEGQKYAD
ncbi:MAG: DapH/DapD/GlmU-related protein [Paludibacter sp.]